MFWKGILFIVKEEISHYEGEPNVSKNLSSFFILDSTNPISIIFYQAVYIYFTHYYTLKPSIDAKLNR